MKQIFLVIFAISVAGSIYSDAVSPPLQQRGMSPAITLKPRQPNWRSEIVKNFASGVPEQILLYEPLIGGGENPVKQLFFYENGKIRTEMDVIAVSEDHPGALEWKSTIIPHGMRIDLTLDGNLRQAAQYQFGLLEGDLKVFFPDGSIEMSSQYLHGKLNGFSQSFFAKDQVKEEVHYYDGKIDGEYVKYHENGAKAVLFPHEEGKLQGMSYEWFPSGALKFERNFVDGQLHGDGKNPAVIAYDEERNVIEAMDFRQGVACGKHIRYHKNGKEAYVATYRNGKKEGKEQFFDEKGALLGEGLFTAGIPKGKHWRNFPNGELAYFAEFEGNSGNSLGPVCEYDQEGNKIRESYIASEKLHGPYFEWYADGTPRCEYTYQMSDFDGEQREYYPSGQMKVLSHCKQGKRHGIHEEWYDNGILTRRISFSDGIKNGRMGEWYLNGNCKLDAYYESDAPDGSQTEWHENGQLKCRVEFTKGVKQGWQREWNEEGDLVFEGSFD